MRVFYPRLQSNSLALKSNNPSAVIAFTKIGKLLWFECFVRTVFVPFSDFPSSGGQSWAEFSAHKNCVLLFELFAGLKLAPKGIAPDIV